MNPKRHQNSWESPVNNASLVVNPTEQDIQNVYSFCQSYSDHLADFVFSSMSIKNLTKNQEPPQIVDCQETFSILMQVLKNQKFIFVDVINQNKGSYKGYISWLIIGTFNNLYLIDAARLHDKCQGLRSVLMNRNLIKFMHQCQQVLFSLKRDFKIFMPNVFDLQVVQRYLTKKGKAGFDAKNFMKEYLDSLPGNGISARPIKSEFLLKLKEYYESEIKLLQNLDSFFATSDPEYQCYAYFNHYEFLLKSYYHHVPSIEELEELHKRNFGLDPNEFSQYSHYQNINLQQPPNQYWQKSPQQKQMAALLCEWREHIAKMRDISGEQVLPYEALSILAKTKVNSILQISQIFQTHSSYSTLSLQDFQQIFELFKLYNEQKQESNHQLVIPRRFPFFKSNDQKPIRELFEELKLSDLGNDWLNNKNDESVKLYKEIVSINQFDNSIIQEYINADPHDSEHLNVADSNKYVKYAEYLRNGNHKKLQDLYQRTLTSSKNLNDEEQLFNQNFISGQQYQNWQQTEKQSEIQSMNSLNGNKQPKISISFQNLNHIGARNSNFLCDGLSSQNEKRIFSLHQMQSPSFFQKVEPLPPNIEAIYMQAAKAKKNYTAKGQKKINKAVRKQSKSNIEGSSKRQEDFVPKKEEIFNLIYY